MSNGYYQKKQQIKASKIGLSNVSKSFRRKEKQKASICS